LYVACYILEKAEGTLEKHKQAALADRVRYCYEAALGIHEMHLHHFAHRDVKPGNIVIVKKRNSIPHIVTKMIDFGLVRKYDCESTQIQKGDRATGTLGY
jgi:serine/threonine protein kinase